MERNECFLVLEEGDDQIRGFIDVTVEPDQVGYVRHLVVDEDYRHRSLGTHLLEAAIAWAAYRHLRLLMAECQTKNYPATALYRKCGLKLCGYNDLLYANKDIALYFARELDT
jgi:ribosomal protein S18 acetylase RimI-like enzyme